MFLHFIATGKFELLGILPTAILPRPIFSRFTRSSFLFSSPSDACQAGYFQDGGTFVSKLPTFKNLFAFVILTLFKLPDPGASIYVQSLLKFPTWGAQGRSKSPPRSVVPPRSGIKLIAALCTSLIEASTYPPGQPPVRLNFLKIFVQIPPSRGRKAVQMPHHRSIPGDQMPPPPGNFSVAFIMLRKLCM